MKRRDLLLSMAASSVAIALPGCVGRSGNKGVSESDVRDMLMDLYGIELPPGQEQAVIASLKGSRYTAAVDPMVQPQCDFDAEVD